jgi:transposase-like protein
MKRHVKCPKCQSLKTKRNGKRKLSKGSIQCFLCFKCNHFFSLRVNKNKTFGFKEKVEITRTHLEGRTSIRTIARHKGISKTTVVKAIHEITSQCAGAAWIAKSLNPQWSGYLGIDGKMIRVWDWAAKHFRYTKEQKRWLHKMSLMACIDLGTLDIAAHHLGDEETSIDLKMCLEGLRETGYPLKGYVTDGNKDIEKIVKMVFGKVPHQLCVIHFLKNIRIKMSAGIITEAQYQDARDNILKGQRPTLLKVPDDLFTYQQVKGLPRTDQATENFFRFVALRMKTVNVFRSWKTAADYLNALILYRRFKKFEDCKGSNKSFNGHAPLELAGCDISELDYLDLENSSRKLVR